MSAPAAWSVAAALLTIFGGVVYLLLRADWEYERDDGKAYNRTGYVGCSMAGLMRSSTKMPCQIMKISSVHRRRL